MIEVDRARAGSVAHVHDDPVAIPLGRTEFFDWLYEVGVVGDPPLQALEAAMARTSHTTDPGLEIAVRSVYGRYAYQLVGDVDSFLRQSADLIEVHGGEAPRWAIWQHHYNSARHLMTSSGPGVAQRSIDAATEVAKTHGLRGCEAKSRAQAAWAKFVVGDFTAASEHCLLAARLNAGRLGAEYNATLVARMCGVVGLVDHGLSIHDAMTVDALDQGHQLSSFSVIERLHLEVVAGNVRQVRAALRNVDDWIDVERQTHLQILRAALDIKVGDPGAALERLLQFFDESSSLSNRGLHYTVATLAARCHQEIGEPAKAVEIINSIDPAVVLASDRLIATEVLAESLEALGSVREAQEAAREALRIRRGFDVHTGAVLGAAERLLQDLGIDLSSGLSKRRFARHHGVPRSVIPGLVDSSPTSDVGAGILGEVADLSHDLRNSLTSLVLAVDALDRGQPFGSGVLQSSIGQIEGMLGRLDGLTGQAETEASLRQPVDVVGVCSTTVALLNSAASQKGMTLELITPVGPAPTSAIDASDLRRVIENLVGNSIRHCDAGATVTVSVESRAGEVTIDILDDGPGMTQGERDRLFRRGERGASAAASRVEGHGLGLSVVQRLVWQANGRLEAFSAGRGQGLHVQVAFSQGLPHEAR